MAASFPTTEKVFTAVTDGVDYPEAVDINSLQEEVAAIEAQVGSAASNISTYNISTASVSTSATTILTLAGGRMCNIVIAGDNGSGYFIDTLVSLPGAAITVLHATTLTGSPAARTYSWSSSNFQLAMASGTYTIRVSALLFKY